MQNETKATKPNYIVHLIYAGSFLLAVLIVLGYVFWQKQQEEVSTENKIAKTKACLIVAINSYTDSWAKACLEQAEEIKSNLNNCISKAKYDTALVWSRLPSAQKNAYLSAIIQCKDFYGDPNPAPDCSLPANDAADLNNQFHDTQELCYKINT